MTTGHQYALDVISGKQVAGKLIQLAAKRFISDLERTDIYFDEAEATKFTNFSENHCRLWEDKWRGTPVILEPWMCFIFEQVYGWFYTETRLRRIRKVYVQVAKKNAKSTLCGVLFNYHLYADDRIQTPKVFNGANNEDQAKIAVNIAGKIIEQSPDLYQFVEDGEVDLFKYKENIVSIVHKERDGFIKAMAKEPEGKEKKASGGKHGFNPSMYGIDEYGMADGAELLETLETAQAAREEPLGFIITTAAYKLNGPCYAKLRRTGVEILEGISEDDSYLPFIFEMDHGDLIYDEQNWIKCNPNLGVSVFPAFLRSQVQKAKNEGGSTEINIRTLNFNEWCETPEVWISKDVWDLNTHGFVKEDLIGRQCYGSIQIISQRELGAFVLFFPNVKPDIHAIIPIFWAPEKFIADNRQKTEYWKWAANGELLECQGNVVDNSFIFDSIISEIRKYQLISASVPVNMEKHDIVQSLANEGIEFNPISQGFKVMSEPTFAWEGLLTAGKIEHFNNPVLRWTNSNCMVKRNGDDIKLERNASRTAGIVCAINALAQWKGNDGKQDETDDFFFVNTTRKK
jgi:phage terminase large subunit-like protein